MSLMTDGVRTTDFNAVNAKNGLYVNGTKVIAADGQLQAAIDIADGDISLEHLDSGIAPAYIVKFAGQHTTAGGDTAETATVTGALATDIAIASIEDNGTNNVTLLQTAAATDAVNFTMSADPSTDCIINYMVLRAAA